MVNYTIMKQDLTQELSMTITQQTVAPSTLESLPQENDYSLLTDLYQLTMTACYVGEQLDQRPASFELFVRKLPKSFGYLIAMGLTQALEYLHNLHFSPAQITALQKLKVFAKAPDAFWQLLAEARFTGKVWAVPEGTAIFAHEPMLRIKAPLWQAQLVETFLLNTINYQTLIATRSARLRDVAGLDATLLEFGTRRAFSPQAALWAARAAIAAGLDTTSNVLAAVQQLAAKVESGKMVVPGIRLDSGDLVAMSQLIKKLLPTTKVFASGDLDEWEIARLRSAGAKIDGYGLGTKLVTGQPVNGVYKLVEIDGQPTMKKAAGKQTYPGQKQIYRQFSQGQWQGDRLGLAAIGQAGLLELVMADGQQLIPSDSLGQIRDRTQRNVASLPAAVRGIDQPPDIQVEIAPDLATLIQDLS